ncbi:Outer membrane efflux protein [Planctomycetes bacterium CA13]|uniref:Outer membrane efflux protein n=1 Tax=Novipirellula herctigrandis TaxID=2527986 RepID=A0A5C5YWM3_9BACT|nr:Outer membrane efflux protein [Planctomycetes bacterium CA13]
MTASGWRNGRSTATALALGFLLIVTVCTNLNAQSNFEAPVQSNLHVEKHVNTSVLGDPAISWEEVLAFESSQSFAPSDQILHSSVDLGLLDREDGFSTLNLPDGIVVPPSPAVDAANRSVRANGTCEGQSWMRDFQSRVESDQTPRWWVSDTSAGLLASDRPWWDEQVRHPLGPSSEPLHVGIAALTTNALRYSSYVRVVSADPAIRQSELVKESAAFDWQAFLETTYDDVNDPIGSTLTTGTDASRYRNRGWSVEAGLRRKNTFGGNLEAYQRLGREEDNSRFLVPNPQRATRLELQYTQPLLRGAGRAYNESQIVSARIQRNRSSDAVAGELQEHLVQVTEAYWELYQTRAKFLQRKKLLDSARSILANLEGRRDIDAVERQVLRAKTAVATRESEMLRAETRIRNWQSQLRLLVNDPALVHMGHRELMPIESPLYWQVQLSMSDSLHTALQNRPDISQAIRDAKNASVKLGVAQKDILPKLDLVASTYVAGLAAASDHGRAYENQFSDGRPSYSVGLQFEIPIGNRASKAQANRRQWELNQAMSQFSLTVEEALTSVEVAVREVQTSYLEVVAKHRSMQAAQNEANYLNDRWRVLPNENDSAAQLLENLLDAQERVADDEQGMVTAQVSYALALVRLKREMGTLLRVSCE